MSEEISWAEWAAPARDQGDCGSCVQFGVLKALETALKIRAEDKNLALDYSEQDLMACSGGTCEQGNYPENALNRLMIGTCTEQCCPYQARTTSCGEGRCSDWTEEGVKIKNWKKLTNWNDMKEALRKGPVIGVMAVHQSFINYVSGVYESQGPWDPIVGYHCIAMMGFSDPKDAALLMNSWDGWGFAIDGVSGFCWIKKGDSEISDVMYSFELDGPITPEPEPSPCQRGNKLAKKLNDISANPTIVRALNPLLWLIHRRGRFYWGTEGFSYLNPPKKGG